MQLIPGKLKAALPRIGSDTQTPLRETTVHVRLHDPAERWRWYILEADDQGEFFGLVVSSAAVVAGRFTEAELENLSFDDGQGGEEGVLVDTSFHPITVGELAKREAGLEEFLDADPANSDGSLVDLS